jgi:hypothetical protein
MTSRVLDDIVGERGIHWLSRPKQGVGDLGRIVT